MIRVNLIPRKREAKSDGTRTWLALVAAAVVLELVVLVIVHANKRRSLDEQLEKNRGIEAAIADKKAKVQNHEAVKRQLAEFQAREDAIAKLQSARTGPTAMLMELSRILTPRKMPSVQPESLERLRRENPQAVPNERWDPHRVALVSFKEQDRLLMISGTGRSNDDVAEFLRRMSVSRYFSDVRLVKTEEKMERETGPAAAGVPVVAFELKAKVTY